MKLFLSGLVCVCAAVMATGEEKKAIDVWTDPDVAAKEHADFLLQGEYTGTIEGKAAAIQAADLDSGSFLVAIYQGGLPGAGWDKSAIVSKKLDRAALKALVMDLEKVDRVSETMGKKAPKGAKVIFAGEANPLIKGTVKDGLLWPPAQTTQPVGSFSLHIEFRLPFKPARPPSNQDRGNSGVYIFNNYECQVLDSFALDYEHPENNAIKPQSMNEQWCGCFYKSKLSDVNMSLPPLSWQTYDIEFTAPVFTDGKKTTNARVTVVHNGVNIHDDFELPKGTGAGGRRPEKEKGLIYLQGHGNPVAYRNIWLLEK